ncbi:hypothetical protein [Nocardia niwae]|uniref:Uncharacterized protein n=1 Tax=Nocardia niwae TaxID=626084 RepID=A0ABV2X868_9NOCA|nr:hypothetical protein [Nocardia niwae]
MLIRSDVISRELVQFTRFLDVEIARLARGSADGVESIGREVAAAARVLDNADIRFARDLDSGNPPSAPPLPGSGSEPLDRFYNGARLWQCEQVFPRAFRGPEPVDGEGFIRTASHSTAGDVVYLTDGNDIAGVYGTITSWTDVRDGTMRFHPAGMVLGIDADRIHVHPMAAEGHSAKNYVEGVSDRVFTTPGRVDTSKIVSVEFQTYEDIISHPDVTLVADGFPGFEGLGQHSLRDPAVVTERLTNIAAAVRDRYPTIDVTVGVNRLSADEAIRTFLAT